MLIGHYKVDGKSNEWSVAAQTEANANYPEGM